MPLVGREVEDHNAADRFGGGFALDLHRAGVRVRHLDVETWQASARTAGFQRQREAIPISGAGRLTATFLAFRSTLENRTFRNHAVQRNRSVERVLRGVRRYGADFMRDRLRRREQTGKSHEAPQPRPRVLWQSMWMGCAMVLIAVGVCVGQSLPAGEEPPTASVDVITYSVSSSSFDGVVRALADERVVTGRPTIASTQILFRPDVRYAEGEGGCTIVDAAVDVRATITMPSWRELRFVRNEDRSAWNRMVERLRRHEDRHVAIAVRHAQELSDMLFALPPAPTCEALDARVGDAQAVMLERHRDAQNAFDRRASSP